MSFASDWRQSGAASTGPRSEERGDIEADGLSHHSRKASTGPRSEERGDAKPSISCCFELLMLQRGRAPKSAEIRDERAEVQSEDGASTGPRSEERGDTAAPVPLARIWWLQRGRAPKSAEIELTKTAISGLEKLQRGRAPKSAEMPRVRLRPAQSRPASTGPRSEERGDRRAARALPSLVAASTGPRSEERGDRRAG